MKRIAFITAALMMVTIPASGAPAQRTVSSKYSAPDGFHTGPPINGFAAAGIWSVGLERHTFAAERKEKMVRFSILDETGLSVRAQVYSDLDGDGANVDEIADFCSISDPIPVHPKETFYVFVMAGRCPDGTTPSVVTGGTVMATFTN